MSINDLYFFRQGQQDAPTVIFVHGLTCDHTDWSQQIEYLAASVDCVAVDLRGHGKSLHLPPVYDIDTLAADVIDLCAQLGISSAVFVGHSMGARVIASITDQAPDLVKGLVFLDGSKFADGDPDVVRQSVLDQLGNDQQTIRFIETMFLAMFTDPGAQDGQQTIISRATNTEPEIFRQLLSNMFVWDATRLVPVIRHITKPITVLQSTTVTEKRERRSLQPGESSAYLELIAKYAPHADITVIPRIGHFTQLDAARQVNQAVENLLAIQD